MKTLAKTSIILATALALTTLGTPKAQAGGWGIAAGVLGGVAAGTIIGTAVANAAAPPVYYYSAPYPAYSYPAYSYAAPAYRAPVVVQQPAPVYYAPPCYPAYAYSYPAVGVGVYFGHPRYYSYYHRRW